MKSRWMLIAALTAAFAFTAAAQQNDPGQQPGGNAPAMPGGMRQGIAGTVTDVASDHYTVKTMQGDTYTIHFSPNTRIVRQPPAPAGSSAQSGGFNRTPPTPIQPSEIKIGDMIMARGEVAPATRTVGAMFIVQMDPERARRMRQMEASFGKTWLGGRITAIDGPKVTLVGGPDRSSYSFVADENTRFRSRRQPLSLADLKVGEAIRVDGAIRNGQFVASRVNLMMVQAMGGPAPRQGNQPPQ